MTSVNAISDLLAKVLILFTGMIAVTIVIAAFGFYDYLKRRK